MRITYRPRSKNEKFALKIYNLIVDNFPQTFFVGGMVRDMLLRRSIADIDIATGARPEQVVKILADNKIKTDSKHQDFGVIRAASGRYSIEVATFRKDLLGKSRYPKVKFIGNPKTDSRRRDFTINALYFSPKSGKILDFQKGIQDLKKRSLRFIGNPGKRITEDPLRIIRALRFAKTLHLNLESRTKKAILKNFRLINSLTKPRIKNELNKIKNPKHRKFVLKTISARKTV